MVCIEGCQHEVLTPYECSYCGELHCVYHRLPEKHDCIALAHAKTLGPEFSSGDDSELFVIGDIEETAEKVNVCIICGSETESNVDVCSSCTQANAKSVYERAKTVEEIGDIVSQKSATSPRSSKQSPGRPEKRPLHECANCSNKILPDKELCLSCRRKDALIDTKSPDISPTGELIVPEQSPEVKPRRDRTYLESVWVVSKYVIVVLVGFMILLTIASDIGVF